MGDFYNIKQIKKARKKHQCECCNSIILVGEPYERHTGIWDGNDLFSFEICPICSQILNHRQDYIGGEFSLYDVITDVYDIDKKFVMEMLKQIKHPSSKVEAFLESEK